MDSNYYHKYLITISVPKQHKNKAFVIIQHFMCTLQPHLTILT